MVFLTLIPERIRIPLSDLYDAARIVDRMDNIHHFSRSVVARDIDDSAVMDLNTAYACLMGTTKHVSISISEPANVSAIAELCYRIAGGEAQFRARPFLTVMVCHVVPPMRFAGEACEVLEAAINAGFPVQLISAGQAGATSPATIAGSLVQAVAETLAGLVFAQLVDPKVKAIFAPKPLVADLRTGSMSGGGGEQAILMAGAGRWGGISTCRHRQLQALPMPNASTHNMAPRNHWPWPWRPMLDPTSSHRRQV